MVLVANSLLRIHRAVAGSSACLHHSSIDQQCYPPPHAQPLSNRATLTFDLLNPQSWTLGCLYVINCTILWPSAL